MACTSQQSLRRTELQTEPILPGGFGLLKALRTFAEVLRDAIALSRACERMLQRHGQRRALQQLDDHLLKDIGLTREQARRECRKRPWE